MYDEFALLRYTSQVPHSEKGGTMNTNHNAHESRKEYYPPRIVHTEKIETRAVACAKADDATCGNGPIQS